MQRLVLGAMLVCGCLLAHPGAARAAESYDNCAGYIDSLPARISTSGVWCLRKNLSTGMSWGWAIEIKANNVTIDCNDFKIGGLAAGSDSLAFGIYAASRQNITVRHCGIRGFYVGMDIREGAGHLIEDNRLDNNLYIGISLQDSVNSLVRRNRIHDTGGYSPNLDYISAFGIYADGADVVDNIVANVFGANPGDAHPAGIYVVGSGAEVRGNQVREVMGVGTRPTYGIASDGPNSTLDRNRVSNSSPVTGSGIHAPADGTFCSNNTVTGYSTSYTDCEYGRGNP